MKLTLAEIERELIKIAQAKECLDEATRQLRVERAFLLNPKVKRTSISLGVTKSLKSSVPRGT